MNRRGLIIATGALALSFFVGGSVAYNAQQARRAREIAAARAEALVRSHSADRARHNRGILRSIV